MPVDVSRLHDGALVYHNQYGAGLVKSILGSEEAGVAIEVDFGSVRGNGVQIVKPETLDWYAERFPGREIWPVMLSLRSGIQPDEDINEGYFYPWWGGD